MSIFSGFNISASGMSAQQLRSDIISQNIANVNTTRTEEGGAYRRKNVLFEEKSSTGNEFNKVLRAASNSISGSGVKVTKIVEDYETEMPKVYDPSHPDADENGYVTRPNVNVITEMTDLIDATRAFEANVTAFNSSKSMILKGLSIGEQ